MRWRAWYADGSVYSSDETSWPDLPPRGMVGVVVFLDGGYRELVQTRDWFWMDADGQIDGVPTHPVWGCWADTPDAPAEMVKQGEGLPDEKWTEIQEEMMATRWP